MRKLLPVLIFSLLSALTFAQTGKSPAQKELISKSDRQYDEVKERIENYIAYQRVVGDTMNADSVRKYFPIMERLATDSIKMVEYDLFKGWFLVKYNLLQSFEHIRNAIKKARSSDNDEMIGQCYLTAGMLCESELDLVPALQYYLAASNYFKLSNDQLNLAACYSRIAALMTVYLQYDRALEYSVTAAKVFYRFGDYFQYGQAMERIVLIYLGQGDVPMARKTTEKMEEVLKDRQEIEGLLKAYITYGNYQSMSGDQATAELYIAKSYGLLQRIKGMSAYRMMPYLAFARMNLNMGQLDKAAQYLKFCDDLAVQIKLHDKEYQTVMDNLNQVKAEYYISIGDIDGARAIYAQKGSQRDAKVIEKMEALVKVSEAEKEENYTIANLQSINEEQRLINERQETKLNYLIVFAALLIFVLAAIYYRYRERQKISKYLETEVESRTQELKAQSQEKTLMLKEIHHRVKNNLQLISSFLNLQKHYSSNDKSTEMIISETQERVRCMAIIHEKLYSAESLSNLDTKAYLSEIAHFVYQSYSNSLSQIELHLNIESSKMALDRMIPCGLIINELLSNCFKYAFKGRESGDVWVDFLVDENQVKRLIFRDNGVGLPEDFSVEKLNSLGMNIVIGLVEQLDGEFTLKSDHGTKFEIRF
ncbi:MAG: sensor histidine kinase [Bacteroidota bacterium]